MSNDINVNKVDEKHKKQAEKLADKYEKQGMGHDQAKNQALSDVAPEKKGHQPDQSDSEPHYKNNQDGHRTGPSQKST